MYTCERKKCCNLFISTDDFVFTIFKGSMIQNNMNLNERKSHSTHEKTVYEIWILLSVLHRTATVCVFSDEYSYHITVPEMNILNLLVGIKFLNLFYI